MSPPKLREDAAVPAGDVAVATLAWRYRGAVRVTAIAKATFAFALDGPMTRIPAQPILRAEVHHGKSPARSVRLTTDLAPYLNRADVLLTGHANAPRGALVETLPVRLGVFHGTEPVLDKTVIVRKPGGVKQVPLVYERAYGGAGFAENPFGLGVPEGRGEPSVIDPLDARRRAGFGPIGQGWLSRKRLLDARGLTREALQGEGVVDLPDDFDWAYFQAAPEDQRIGFLRGDEWIVMAGLHPQHAQLRTCLPGARGIAHVYGLGPRGVAEGQAIALHADTLRIDADEEHCTLTFRATFPVADAAALPRVRVVLGVETPDKRVRWPDPASFLPSGADPHESVDIPLSAEDLEIVKGNVLEGTMRFESAPGDDGSDVLMEKTLAVPGREGGGQPPGRAAATPLDTTAWSEPLPAPSGALPFQGSASSPSPLRQPSAPLAHAGVRLSDGGGTMMQLPEDEVVAAQRNVLPFAGTAAPPPAAPPPPAPPPPSVRLPPPVAPPRRAPPPIEVTPLPPVVVPLPPPSVKPTPEPQPSAWSWAPAPEPPAPVAAAPPPPAPVAAAPPPPAPIAVAPPPPAPSPSPALTGRPAGATGEGAPVTALGKHFLATMALVGDPAPLPGGGALGTAAFAPFELGIFEEHADQAAFLWTRREDAAGDRFHDLDDLCRLDERIEAHLDGLRLAGDAGWDAARAALAVPGAGAAFVATVASIGRVDRAGLAHVLDTLGRGPNGMDGVVSALGWIPSEALAPILPALLHADGPPALGYLGIAGSAFHRIDPGQPLSRAVVSTDVRLRSRALLAAGELGRADLRVVVRDALADQDDACRFAAGFASVLLGEAEGVRALVALAEGRGPFAERAAETATRRMPPGAARSWLQALGAAPGGARIALAGSAALGDAGMVLWIVDWMTDPALARPAGAALTMITGASLRAERLEGRAPAGFKAGPTEDANDDDVAMDPDEGLSWPALDAVQRWWERKRAAFPVERRHLMGKPLSPEWLEDLLRSGRQRVRAAAAVELSLSGRRRVLFEVRARGPRQRQELGRAG